MQLAPKEQEFLPYRVVDTPGCGEYEEKKSRFIAHVYPAQSEEEAMGLIEQTRKKYYDARHNCTAYIIGRNRELKRCSDDGEPGGTAGKPMLEVLLSEGITNVVVIVTRYFGGTLLGTGGLVRAYTQAVKEGLADAGIRTMIYGVCFTLKLAYTDVGKIQYLLANEQIAIGESRYTQNVEFDLQIPKERAEEIRRKLTEATAGRIQIEQISEGYYTDISG